MAWDNRYRRLNEGEIIQDGDECLTDSHLGWQPANFIGQPAPDPCYTAHRMYRRLKAPVADSTGAPTMLDAAAMRDVARALDGVLNGTAMATGKSRQSGFVLLTFPSRHRWPSQLHLSRKDMIAFLKETAARFDGQSLQGGNA